MAEGFRRKIEGVEGESCHLEPEGTVKVRTDDGSWAEVVFDGEDAAELCDGCGSVTWDGEELGSICIDQTGAVTIDEDQW